MSGNKPVIYFDSCVWIGMITGQMRPDASESSALSGLVTQLDKRQLVVVVSTLVRVEVLDADMNDQQKEVFRNLMKIRSVIQMKDASAPIMDLAHDIRNYYRAKKSKEQSSLKPPSTPDAIHLATAIYYECDKFYTLDANDKPTCCGLLKMQNPIAGKYTLDICKPQVIQPGFAV